MASIKLSAAQQRVMDQAHEDIRQARECATVEEWFAKYKAMYYTRVTMEEFRDNDPEYWESIVVNSYNRNRSGVVLTQCSSKTLAKLEKLGLIEIIHDSNGQHYGIDKIRVLDV